jgi:hypothetical protein
MPPLAALATAPAGAPQPNDNARVLMSHGDPIEDDVSGRLLALADTLS